MGLRRIGRTRQRAPESVVRLWEPDWQSRSCPSLILVWFRVHVGGQSDVLPTLREPSSAPFSQVSCRDEGSAGRGADPAESGFLLVLSWPGPTFSPPPPHEMAPPRSAVYPQLACGGRPRPARWPSWLLTDRAISHSDLQPICTSIRLCTSSTHRLLCILTLFLSRPLHLPSGNGKAGGSPGWCLPHRPKLGSSKPSPLFLHAR